VPDPAPSPSPRELEALKALWRLGPSTVREVHRAMAPREGALAYTTTLSLLQTMERKGMVGHEPAGKAYAYFAKARRDAVFRGLAGDLLERAFDGSLADYVARGLQARRPTLAEIEAVEAAVAAAKAEALARER